MENFKNIFETAIKEKNKKADKWESYLENIWDKRFNGVIEILENLEFLKDKGYKIEADNFHEFNKEKANKSYYPTVRINDITMISKSVGNDFIGVSGLGKFPLMGEKHTYESFIKKLIS